MWTRCRRPAPTPIAHGTNRIRTKGRFWAWLGCKAASTTGAGCLRGLLRGPEAQGSCDESRLSMQERKSCTATEYPDLLPSAALQARPLPRHPSCGLPAGAARCALGSLDSLKAPATCELVSRLRACQLAAWKIGIHIRIDFDVLLSHQERPSTPPHRLDQQLMRYRQPQRIVTSSLTIRGMPLNDIRRITLHQALNDPRLESIIDDASNDLATAWQPLINLRLLEGANPIEALLPQSERTLASFVIQASADSGISIAGRRIERTRSPIRWLGQLGIAVRSLP